MTLVLIFTVRIGVVMNNHFLGQSLNTSALKLIARIKVAWRKTVNISRLLIHVSKLSSRMVH